MKNPGRFLPFFLFFILTKRRIYRLFAFFLEQSSFYPLALASFCDPANSVLATPWHILPIFVLFNLLKYAVGSTVVCE
jgi:hypothetical protein